MRIERESSSAPPVMVYLIRALGVVVLLVGLATAIKVLERAWDLLGDHRTVIELSAAIDKQSGLTAFLGKNAPQLSGVMGRREEAADESREGTAEKAKGNLAMAADANRAAPSLRPSYFMAWSLAIIVLFLLARIALSLVVTGANLALKTASGDEHMRALVKELVYEIRASRDGPTAGQ